MSVRAVLLVVDLEGVSGVDDIGSLLASSASYPNARRALTAEVNAAVRGLRARGVERIRISDSHRAGGATPNVIVEQLPPDVEVRVEQDAYAPVLFDGIDAVACLGMHAGAETAGFAAHTMNVHCAWRVGDRDLSETDLVMGHAAERALPMLFVSGDDVLAGTTPGVSFVQTKTSIGRSLAQSRPAEACAADIEQAARTAEPRGAIALSAALTLRFKRRWQADAAERAGGRRHTTTDVEVVGASFGDAYRRGCTLVAASERTLAAALRAGNRNTLATDIENALCGEFPAAAASRSAEARAALRWFLAETMGDAAWKRADRALVLHMLRGHAPGFATAVGLGPLLDEAVRALRSVDSTFPLGLHPMEAMARLDALYVAHEHGIPRSIDHAELQRYIVSLTSSQPLFAWLLSELAAQMGVARTITFPVRPLRHRARLPDLYWLTHEVLLETRYLSLPLPTRGWEVRTEELALAVPELVAEARADLAAEVAICLQAAGEGDSAEHARVVAMLAKLQEPSGRVIDPPSLAVSDVSDRERRLAHTTAAALVAFAGISDAATRAR